MRILQAGRPKSGNYWLYKILQSVATYGGLEQHSFIQNHPIHKLAKNWPLSYKEQAGIDVLDIEPYQCFYRISSIFRMPIEDIDHYISQCSHVWSHSEFCDQCLVVLPKFDKIIYIIRDPRDAAVSMSRFAFTPYMLKYYPHNKTDPDTYLADGLNHKVRYWVQHVGGYLKYKDTLHIHVIFFERLFHSFDTELARLLAYLEIELDQKAIALVKREVDFSTMQRENPHHVRRGKSGQWAEILTHEQKGQAVDIAGPMLRLLNYPLSENQVDNTLPNVHAQLSVDQIEQAETSASHTRRTFIQKVKRVYEFIIE